MMLRNGKRNPPAVKLGKARVPKQNKDLQKLIMGYVLEEIEAEKKRIMEGKGGATSRAVTYGVTKQIIAKYKTANLWLTRDALDNYKRYKFLMDRLTKDVVTTVMAPTAISDLTNTSAEAIDSTAEEIEPTINFCNSDMAQAICKTNSDTSDDERTNGNHWKKAGRPKGSTMEKKLINEIIRKL
jgi:hypothetical protein